MTFKKYSIKSHYKVNKLVRIKKLTIFKNLIEVSNTNETTKVFFFKYNIKFQKTKSRANKTFFA